VGQTQKHAMETGTTESGLLQDLRTLILETRQAFASTVNAGLTTLYWRLGRRVQEDLLQQNRAEYGAAIIISVARQLEADFGTSFGEKNLRHMLKFAEVFPDEQIVYALRRQLSWSHFRTLIYLQDPLKRSFYTEMTKLEGWSTRTLHRNIDGMLFERTAVARKPEKLIHKELSVLREEGSLSPDLVFRDPYVLNFLGLSDTYSEQDLEQAILRELETFLLELGIGFTFVARQKRMVIDNEDHSLDLLFFHRRLKRLVAVELKLGKFKAAYKGQMELYLRWLEVHEQGPGEESPLGLILCGATSHEAVELLRLDEAGIRVAEYLTELPPREMLEKKLHAAITHARAALERGPNYA
jgi:predicted nuclease of restriction endonuclease-like (RecB) superfamily